MPLLNEFGVTMIFLDILGLARKSELHLERELSLYWFFTCYLWVCINPVGDKRYPYNDVTITVLMLISIVFLFHCFPIVVFSASPHVFLLINPVRLMLDYMTLLWLNSFALNLAQHAVSTHPFYLQTQPSTANSTHGMSTATIYHNGSNFHQIMTV